MEQYQGVKFAYRRLAETFSVDTEQLLTLNRWAYLFSQLGLTPLHRSGAFGNQSCRTGPDSFVITKSGMVPEEQLHHSNFCHIVGFEEATNTFAIEGASLPSSESLLHQAIYTAHPRIHAILHGHSALFMQFADELAIPTTTHAAPYGTRQLADSALAIINGETSFFILKEHGFVALGTAIDAAGRLTLTFLSRLLTFL